MKYGKEIAVGIASGLFASWIKAVVEPPLQEIGENKFPPSLLEKSLNGADVNGQPEKMPPAVMVEEVYNFVTKKELSKKQKVKSLKVTHYLFGAIVGVGYAIAAKKCKKITAVGGLPAGAAVWGITHGSILPAAGWQGPVKKMPKSWWIWEFGSHLIFGGALESSRRLLAGDPDKEVKSKK